MENITYKGHVIKIEQDEFASNPRTEDYDCNLGVMVCFHNRYDLGDKKKHSFKYIEELQAFFDEDKDHVVSLPLYLYDHGGITISTSPFSCRWDSGQVGFIYTTKEQVIKEYGAWNDETKEQALGRLDGEVEAYDTWLKGEVYYYSIEGELCDDSCGGFTGMNHEESGLLMDAKNNIDSALRQEIDAKEFEKKHSAT